MMAFLHQTSTDDGTAWSAADDPQEAMVALALAAKAVTAWYGGSDRAVAFAALRDAMARAARATAGQIPARSPREFLALLCRPVNSWLGLSPDEPLVEHGEPTAYCLDVIAEAGNGGGEPKAEVVQARVGDARATFSVRPQGDSEYAAFRLSDPARA
jgi:hypothetical protein